MAVKITNIEDLKKLYDDLLPWDKVEFCEWIKTREEFEIDPDLDLDYTEISLESIADRYTDDDFLHECDDSSIVDYVLDHRLDYMVIDQLDEKYLAEYIEENIPAVSEYLMKEEITDKERDRIFDVAYDQGFRDGKNGKKNKCKPNDF